MASSATSSTSFPISHLSTINVSNFVPSKLHGDEISNNYSSWKKQMLRLIKTHDLVRFIDGEIQSREEEEDAIQRTDGLVMSWILGALDEDVLKIVDDLPTARDVWLELEKIFSDPADQLQQAEGKEWHVHLPLYRAALTGDWNKAKAILDQDPDAVEAKLNSNLQTALHIAVGNKGAFDFIKKLVDCMPDGLLGLKDYLGFTALHVAAQSGNTKAAKILVNRWPDLLHEPNNDGEFPVHVAATSRRKETLKYFIYDTEDDSPFLDETSGVKLLCMLIDANIFDLALHLAEKYPHLATVKLKDGNCALKRIALKKGARLPRDPIFRWFYNIHPEDRTTMNTSDIEGPIHPENSKRDRSTWSLYELSCYMPYVLISIWCLGYYYINPVYVKQYHEQATKLVKCLCKNMESLDYCRASAIYKDAILTAAQSGFHEIIEEIVATFPEAIYTRSTNTKKSIFHVAAESHHLRVFDLINQTTNLKHEMSDMRDIYGNTVLHSAAKVGSGLSHPGRFTLIEGAALQMLRKLLWFYEISNIVTPDTQQKENRAGKNAWEVFGEQLAALNAQVEKWDKDTSQACSIVAALIATVTFAAAITVPGGLDTKHLPVFSDDTPFKAFTWFTIISFLTSITSLFLFLITNIFLYSKDKLIYNPGITITNLSILFVSVISMTGAFISAIYLLFKDQNTVIVFSISLLYLLIPSFVFLINYFPLFRTSWRISHIMSKFF